MDWLLQDWEYTCDEVYALERQKEVEASWQEWEENRKRKPAIIKVVTPEKIHEAKYKSSTVRGTNQERL